MTYDSKRRRCVLFGGYTNRRRWNDLWWLDLEASAWRCLQAADHEGPAVEKTRPRGTGNPYFIYDSKADTCWLLGHNGPLWGWRPEPGTWAACEKAPQYYGSSYALNGWAYHPGTGDFLRVGSTGNTYLVRPPANKHEKIVRCVLPGAIYIHGGLAYDPSARIFVLYGGRHTHKGPVDHTWTFDLPTRTWRRMRPEARPPARGHHKLLWHPGLGALVLTGPTASADDPKRRDLWVYETAANRWTEVKTPTGPPPDNAATACHQERGCLVLFTVKAHTWVLDIKRADPKR
jgi:hypothetical protein